MSTTAGASLNALRLPQKGVTQKALTQCLRRLEANGFIKRVVVSTAPIAVTYEISPLGRSLGPHLQAIPSWATEQGDDVRAAQQAFIASRASSHLRRCTCRRSLDRAEHNSCSPQI